MSPTGGSKKQRPVTLTDVARLAGVSIPSASRVLNAGVRGPGTGNEETRKKVLAAAEKLGYTVSLAAQTMKNGRSRTVALVVGDIDDFGAATIISGVMHAAEERGLSLAVRATRDDPRRERAILREMRADRLLAVIFATSRSTDVARERAMDAELRTLRDLGARIVLIGDSTLDYPSVTIDNAKAANALARGLVAAGHRRFAIVAGPEGEVTSQDRADGFRAGLRAEGIEVADADVVHAEFTRNGGFEAGSKLAGRVQSFDHIAAMSDGMAVGVVASLRDAGVHVPDDVEVSGFDHVPMLGDVMPSFSTVEVPLDAFGEAAFSLIEARSPGTVSTISLSAFPIVRGVRIGIDA